MAATRLGHSASAARAAAEFGTGIFAERNVLEVQTPVLAKHTVTEPDIQSIEVPGFGYLQTSPEYHIKRLLAAGAPSCYQLGPAFRFGEQGRLHNPEFTMLEWYRLDFDHWLLMDEVAELVDQLLGAKPYQQLSYTDLVGPLGDRPRDELDLALCAPASDCRLAVFLLPTIQPIRLRWLG